MDSWYEEYRSFIAEKAKEYDERIAEKFNQLAEVAAMAEDIKLVEKELAEKKKLHEERSANLMSKFFDSLDNSTVLNSQSSLIRKNVEKEKPTPKTCPLRSEKEMKMHPKKLTRPTKNLVKKGLLMLKNVNKTYVTIPLPEKNLHKMK